MNFLSEAAMKVCIKSLTGLFAACALSLAQAQSYPTRPITMIVPLQAGSSLDVVIRIVAQKMSESLGQQIVLENQPGAAGAIGAERVMRATPDVREKLVAQGIDVETSTPEQLTALTKARLEQMAWIIKDAGVVIE